MTVKTISISMTSPDFDSFIQLFDASEETPPLAFSSHGGAGSPAVLGPIALNPGLYEVEASTWLDGPTGSFTVSVTAPPVCPSVPSGLSVGNVSLTSSTVSWNTSGEPPGASYDVQRTGAASTLFANVTTPWNDAGLVAGQSYCYQVRASVSGCGPTDWSTAACITTSTNSCAGLSIPSGLTVTAASPSSLRISWSTVGEPAGTTYDLERDGIIISGVTQPYTDGSFTAGSLHTYRIRAVKPSCTTTDWSNYVTGSTSGGGTLGDSCANPFILPTTAFPYTVQGTTVGFTNTINTVPNVGCGGGSGTSSCGPDVFYQFTAPTTETYVVNIVGNNWSNNNRWISYAINGCTLACVNIASYAEGPGSNYYSIYATAGTTYTIVIDGQGAFSCSAGAYEMSIGKCSPLHTPPNFQAIATSSTSVALTWDATGQPPGSTTTVRRTNPDSTYSYFTASGYYDDTSVQPGTRYTYAVGAGSGACGSAALSSPITLTTPADPCQGLQTPSGLSVGSATPASLTITWTTSAQPAGTTYDLQRTGGGTTVVLPGVTAPYIDTGLLPSTRYSYAVRAVRPGCAVSPTSFSATAGATTSCSTLSISSQPAAQIDVCSGEPATLSVHVDGSGPITYQWQKNGTNLSGATSAIYQISAASTSDSGSYVCVITNACGQTITSPTTVSITGSPTPAITAPSIVCPGTSSFNVSVPDAGSGSTYTWSVLNGTILSGSGTRLISVSPGMSGSVTISITVQNESCSTSATVAIPITCHWYDNYNFAAKGVVAYWPFDDDSNDKSGNGNNGTWTSGGSFVPGEFGNGYSFAPGVYYEVSNPSAPLLNYSTITLAAWFKYTSALDNENLLGAGLDGLPSHYYMFILPGLPGIGFNALNSSGQPLGTTNNTTVLNLAGQWHHIAATFDGTTATLYIDGMPLSSNNASGSIALSAGTPFYINRHDWSGGNSGGRLTGVIDDAVIFNRALSSSEIIALAKDSNGIGEPDFWNGLVSPTNLIATVNSSSSVTLAWNSVPTATFYTIYRESPGTPFVSLGTQTTSTFIDNTVAPNTSYLYRVTSNNAAGTSVPSNVDLATTVIFTDVPLTPATPIKATHITELRTAVNAVRALARLSPYSFTDATIIPGVTVIKAVHITELRAALDAARAALALPTLAYTDVPMTPQVTPVKSIHIIEVRNGVK